MDEKQLQLLFDQYGQKSGFSDFAEFKGLMADSSARRVFFDNSNKDLGFKDYNEFESLIGFKKKDGGVVSSPSMESPLPSPSVGIDPAEIQKRYDRVGKGRTYLNELIDKKRTELPDFAPMATDFVRSAAQFNEAGKKAERTNLVYDFFDKNFDVNTNDNTRDAFISSQYAGTYFSESPDLKYEYDKSDMKSMLTPRQFSGLKSLSFGRQSEYGEAIKKLSDPNVGEAEKSVIKLELDKIGVGIDKDAAAAMVNQGVNSDIATQIFSKAKADEPLIEESLRNVDYENPYSIRTFKNVIKGATERGYLVGERADLVTATAEETGIDVDRLAYLQGELKNSKASKAYEQFSENPSFENFKKAPIGIMLELSLESLAALYTHGASRMAAGAATGAVVGSVLPGAGTAAGASYGTISGMGLASLNLEYSSSILEGLDAIGVNTADPEALRSAFSSEETMSKLKRTAYAKSIPVAIFDMLSAGIAGKIVTKPAKTVLGKVAGGVAEMGVQAAAGMAGEAAGQLAAEGRIYAPNAVLLEGLGELGPGVIEVAYGSMVESAKRNRPIAKADAVNVVASGQQETVRQNVDAEVKAGTMSQEQANVVKEEIAKTEVSVAKIPDDLSVDAKSQIVELIEKKSELSAKAKTLDDAFKQDVETQIADVDQQIIQITQNDRNATVQSQVEQQAGPAEGGVQERPGVDGGQQEVGQGAGQQGQAPVTQPDTGNRVLSSQEEVALAGELRGELRQDFQPIIDRAAQSLQAANVQFEVLDDAEFTARVGQSAEGAFMTVGNDGKILLNRQKMEQADPGVIIWHESAHPVMNTIRNTNKPLYDRMVTGLKQVAQRSPELQRALEFGKQYGAKLREAGRGDAEAIALEDDESIVESIAMIAADDKLMASLPTSVKQTLIDFVNYIAKALGIKGRVTNTASADFRRTAQQIATALKEGRDISEIVGAENVREIDNRIASEYASASNSANPDQSIDFDTPIQLSIAGRDAGPEPSGWLKSDMFISASDIPNLSISKVIFYDNTKVGPIELRNRLDQNLVSKANGKGGFGYSFQEEALNTKALLAFTSPGAASQIINRQAMFPDSVMAVAMQNPMSAHLGNITTKELLWGPDGQFRLVATNKKRDSQIVKIFKESVSAARALSKSDVDIAAYDRIIAKFQSIKTVEDIYNVAMNPESFGIRNQIHVAMLQEKPTKVTASTRESHKILHYELGIPTLKEIADAVSEDYFKNATTGDLVKYVKPSTEKVVYTTLPEVYEKYKTTKADYKVEFLDGMPNHESYPFVIKGENIGIGEKYFGANDVFESIREKGVTKKGSFFPVGRMKKDSPIGAIPQTAETYGSPNVQLSIGSRQAIIGKAKADGTYLKAPNGQPTNLSEDQWTTVRTPEFKNWFGDWENDPENASKVVDENGEPMVVYHGSSKSFDTFMAGRAEGWGEGMYFASEESDTAEFGGIVYPVFLNIRNPINESNINKVGDDVARTKVWEDESKRRRMWDEEEGVSELDYRDELEENVDLANKSWRELGYDGIMFFGSNNINGFEIVAFQPNQIKSATSNVGTFSTEDARIQLSIGGRQPVGQINWERSLEGKGDPSISSRNPMVTRAAQDLKDGKITNEEYRATVSENSPIRPITRFFEPATEQQVKSSLSVDKSDKANAPLTDGTIVGLRLDIPAYQNKNTWVVSVHEGNTNAGKPISYRNVAMIRNVKFGSTPKGVLNIASGKEKQTIGRMFGEWVNIPGQTMEQQGENAKRMVQDIVDNPEYVQVGMNPFRHSYFYDRSNDMGRPLVSAEEVIQVGGLVYAKNPVYGNWTDESYAVKGLFDAAGKQVQFSIGNRDSIVRSLSMVDPAIKQELKKMSEPSAVTADDLSMFFRMPDGTYSDGNDDYDSWNNLKQVGEDNDLRLRQSTPEEIRSKRYEDKYVLDNILEEKENEILQKQFDSKMEVWNFFNDEGLNRLGYNSPMEMSDVDRQIHAALVKKGVEEFERQELSTLADAYEIIGNSVDESIADAYLKAKADGASQEFVRRVDSAIESRQLSAGPRAESRVEFKLVAFVLRKKAEGYTDQQIAVAINSALPTMAPQDIARLIQDPQQYLVDSFPGFTAAQHSNLYERAKIANIFRYAPQRNIHPFFRSLRVDPDVIKQYYERTKTKREVANEWARSIFTKNFKPSRGLENWMMQAKEFAKGAMNLEIANAKKTIDQLEAVAKEIGFENWSLFSEAMVDAGMMSGSSQLALPSPVPASITRLPLEIQPYVTMMRDQIDGLTSRLIGLGYVTPEQAITLQNNVGQYVNRAYRLFSESGYRPEPKVRNAAIDFLTNQEYARLVQEFYDKNTTPATGQTSISGGPTVGGLANIPYDQLMEQAAKNAAVQVERILNKKANPYFGDAKVESRSIGVLKQKKDIPVEIRRLMGEYTDPGVVFMMTVVKQSALLASSQYLKDLRTRGMGTVFFEANDPNIPPTHSVQMASEGSSVLEPLNGLYTTPEIAEALNYIEPTYNAAMQIWMKGVGMVRMGKTVLSPVTQIINFIGNLGFAVLNGLIFTKTGRPFGAAMGEAWEYAKGQYKTKEDFNAVTKKMIKLGIVGQSVDANSISEAFSSGDLFDVALDVALTGDGIFKTVKKNRVRPVAFFENLYRMGDDFWKVYAYISEREAYSSAKYKKKYADLSTEEQDIVDAEASERVKRTWPTFSRMFPIVRTLNKMVPLLGDFTGFQAESIRNPINIVQIALKDLKDPDLQASGARRMAAFTAYIGIQTAVTAAIPIMLGYGAKGLIGKLINDDDEEEKKWALDEAAPPHMYHHDKVAVPSEKSPHILTVISMNANNPINWTQLAVNAYFDGTSDMSAGALAAVVEIGSRFLGLGMTTEAVFDVQYNTNSSNGKPIYIGGKMSEGGDPDEDKLMKSLDYVWNKLQPSAVKLYDRWSTTNNPGMEGAAALGFRTYEIDLHKSFSVHLSRASKTLTDIDGELKAVTMFDKKATEEMKKEATDEANEKKMAVVQNLNRLYRAYIKLGADPKVMRQTVARKSAVKLTGMDNKTKAGILNGDIKPNFY